MRVFIPRLLGASLYLLELTLVGVVGYTLIEGWGFQDALYMSVITITVVGYSEVLPLSTVGRDFTMVLLAAGVTGIGVWFALIISLIVEFDLSDVRGRRRIMRSIEALNDHIVLWGGWAPGHGGVDAPGARLGRHRARLQALGVDS
jgi:voltage-gated potassium channel